LLTEVLGFSAAEVADALETSVASVNSALQRARATLATRPLDDAPTPEGAEAELVEQYVAAFERYDTDALAALMHQDAIMSMPPYTLWLRGHESIRAWLLGRGIGCRGSHLVATRASGLPAFAQYRATHDGGHRAWALNVLELSGGRIARTTFFLDVEALFPTFGLRLELPQR
jgi:RNA polymerase sigma-70 factor (ECF subfamily)